MRAAEFLREKKTNFPFAVGSWSKEREVADRTTCSQMDTRPGATNSGDRKWTGLASNKLAELGLARTLRENHYPAGLLSGTPISNRNVFHMCVCVQHF